MLALSLASSQLMPAGAVEGLREVELGEGGNYAMIPWLGQHPVDACRVGA